MEPKKGMPSVIAIRRVADARGLRLAGFLVFAVGSLPAWSTSSI